MSDVQYGVIHEVGEFQDIKPLTEEENKIVNEADHHEEIHGSQEQ